MKDFKTYPKIPAWGYDGTEDILDGEIVIQPKLDGSNVSIWINNGTYYCGRRNDLIDGEEGSFKVFTDWVDSQYETNGVFKTLVDNSKGPPRVFFGEFVNNQGKLKYENKLPFVLFDTAIYGNTDDGHLNFEDYMAVVAWSISLNWPMAQHIYFGPGSFYKNVDEIIEKHLNQVSMLGGPNEEGIVVKSYGRKTRFGRNYFVKLVTPEFSEKKSVKLRTPKEGSGIGEWAKDSFLTPARVRKAIQKLKEGGEWHEANARKNTGKLIGVVVKDIHDEHIDEINKKGLDLIWKEASKAISSEVINVLDEVMREDSDGRSADQAT